jgi:hypothetical protein
MIMLNVERLTELAFWLEAGAPHKGMVKGFNIAVGVQARAGETPDCGTVCCIAGAATQFFNDEDGYLRNSAFIEASHGHDGSTGEAPWPEVFDKAQHLLGLDYDQARELFVPIGASGDGIYGFGDGNWEDYNDPKLAAKVIRNLIETNEVNWDINE